MTQFFDLSSLGLGTSQAQAQQAWLTAMAATYPGFNPSTANPLTVQASVFASWAADNGGQAAAGSAELFRQYGTKLLGTPFQQGTPATAVATVTASDTAGHTLPAGTQITLSLNGAQIAFQTAAALVIAGGASTGTVTVAAIQNGITFNGATNPATLVSQINWVSGVSVAAPASGGADQESPDHFLQRLVGTLQLQAPRPITASDFAGMALNFTPIAGTAQQLVGRAAAIDGYNPADGTTNNQRMVGVCPTDSSGQALNTDTMYGVGGSAGNVITNSAQWGIAGWLQSLRELNFIVNVVAPNYTTVYVACTVKALAGYTTATVQANVQSALLTYLTPANFGLPTGAAVGWQNTTSVYRSKVLSVIQAAQGVAFVQSCAIDINSNPTNTTSDTALPGVFPLPLSTTTSIPLAAITVT